MSASRILGEEGSVTYLINMKSIQDLDDVRMTRYLRKSKFGNIGIDYTLNIAYIN